MASRVMLNRLTQEMHYKMCEELKKWKGDMEAGAETVASVTQKLTESLGFSLAKHSVRDACELVGIVPKKSPNETGGGKARQTLERYLALEARVESLEKVVMELSARKSEMKADISILRGLCHELYYQLSASPPAGYQLPPDARGQKPVAVANNARR